MNGESGKIGVGQGVRWGGVPSRCRDDAAQDGRRAGGQPALRICKKIARNGAGGVEPRPYAFAWSFMQARPGILWREKRAGVLPALFQFNSRPAAVHLMPMATTMMPNSSAAAAPSHWPITVATAAPAMPMGAMPRVALPKINTGSRRIFSTAPVPWVNRV